MSVLAYGLMMLGCADDGTACKQLNIATTRYAAAAECEAQIETALMSDAAMRADYPIVEARCVPLHSNQRGAPGAPRLARR